LRLRQQGIDGIDGDGGQVEEGAGHGVILPSGGVFGCYTPKSLPVTQIHCGITVAHVSATACDPPGRPPTRSRPENLPAASRSRIDSAR
jgi:hypothetical protein